MTLIGIYIRPIVSAQHVFTVLPRSLKSSYLICYSFLRYLPFAFSPLFISAMSLFRSPPCGPDKVVEDENTLNTFRKKKIK